MLYFLLVFPKNYFPLHLFSLFLSMWSILPSFCWILFFPYLFCFIQYFLLLALQEPNMNESSSGNISLLNLKYLSKNYPNLKWLGGFFFLCYWEEKNIYSLSLLYINRDTTKNIQRWLLILVTVLVFLLRVWVYYPSLVHALFVSMLHFGMLTKSVNLSQIYAYLKNYKD